MTVDLACGESAFVDLTFAGLDAVPAPGEERHARALLRSPGGAAITAIGAARLGLRTALASPIGDDTEGDFLRDALAAADVEWTGRTGSRTAVTAVLPAAGERAMATVDAVEQVSAADLAALDPRAVVLALPRVDLAPAGCRVYATVGDADARGGLPDTDLGAVRALLVNEREGRLLTGRDGAVEAAIALAGRVACAIVTRGAVGAVAAAGDEICDVAGVPAHVVDTTGAGDLFCAAYIWADHHDLALEERVRWAVLYAALSVGVPTGAAGAVSLDELAQAGQSHGLALPARAASVSMTRRNP